MLAMGDTRTRYEVFNRLLRRSQTMVKLMKIMDLREFKDLSKVLVENVFDILDFGKKNFDAVLLFLLIIAVSAKSYEIS